MVTLERSSVGFGHWRPMASKVATRIEATAQFRYHFLSAGTTCHGAWSVAVRSTASAKAVW